MSSGWWERLKQNVGIDAPQEEIQTNSLLQHLDEASTLSKTQRVYGFATCIVLSIIFSMLSWMVFLVPVKFAILYTLSNLCAVGSTMFLMGPVKQLSKMFDKGRIVATVIFLASIGLTLWSALYLHNLILTILFLIIQLGALVWYCLSYIPFAQEMVSRLEFTDGEAWRINGLQLVEVVYSNIMYSGFLTKLIRLERSQ